MKFNLRTKLTAAFLVTTLMLFALISIFANVILENQFKDYVISQQEQRNKVTVSTITGRYADWGGKWDLDGIETIGVSSLENGLMLRVSDSSGAVIWDAMVHNSGLCASIINNMSKTMKNHYINFQGGYTEKLYPIMFKGEAAGTIAVGFYGPYFFTDNDIRFLDTLNRLLQIAALIALLISFVLGAIMAKQLSNPINDVISRAAKITKGDYKDRLSEKSTTTEIHDLTVTFNALAETLDMQESLRKRLSADVAHELRTPLTTLQGHLEAMIDGIWEMDPDRLKGCHEEVLRINRMIGDMETLARHEGENLILNKTKFDITELIQSIIKNFETDFAITEIKVSFQGQVEEITADKDKISQLVINLVSNAIKYTLKGGSVYIGVTGSDTETGISVKDNGMGIPLEDLPFIFERFYRADKSRNRMTGGSGIGLAIVKSIVDAHKGNISVQSELNVGSEFIVTFPKARIL